MSNVPKAHNNTATRDLLSGYLNAYELCKDHPPIEDIFSGALELKTEGNTSTRALSRRALFVILQQCDSIDVASIGRLLEGRYSYRSLAGYAAVARVASKAIESYLQSASGVTPAVPIGQARHDLDAPYFSELEAVGLT